MHVARFAVSFALLTALVTAPTIARADGGVTAYVANQSLYVLGDDEANVIAVTQGASPDEFVVSGNFDETSVNGAFIPVVLDGVVKDIRIEMNGGDDNVSVAELNVPRNLSVKMETNSDVLLVYDVLVGRNATLSGGSDSDLIELGNLEVTGKLKVLTQDGDDSVDAAQVTVGRNVKVSAGNGDDFVRFEVSTFDNKCRVVTSSGMDEVELLDVAISGKTAMSLGDDDDVVSLGNVSADNRVVLNGGSGFNAYNDLGGNNIAEGPILKKF